MMESPVYYYDEDLYEIVNNLVEYDLNNISILEWMLVGKDKLIHCIEPYPEAIIERDKDGIRIKTLKK